MFHRAFAQADDPLVFKVGAGEHLVKRGGQFLRRRAYDLQAEIAPAARDAVACPFGRDVEPADDRDAVVAHQQLPVVANVEAPERNRIEPAQVAAGLAQRFPETVRECDRAERIDEDLDANAAPGGARQGAAETLTPRPGR